MAFARTVTGDIPVEELGVTLPHEHLIGDLGGVITQDKRFSFDEGSSIEMERLEAEVTMENRQWMIKDHLQPEGLSLKNRRLDDVETSVAEAGRFQAKGGDTIVDVTSSGLGRDPQAMLEIARRTGLNVIAGTGYYVRHSHPPDMDEKTVEEIADEITSDVEEGMDDTTIRAGVIGEIGATYGFLDHENEVKSFRAAAIAQQRTGAPITVHPPFFYQEAHDVLDVLKDAGADLDNVILDHLDGTLRDEDSLEYHRSLGERGVFLEFDIFGSSAYSPGTSKSWPQDEDRILRMRRLFEDGFGDRLLMSQDIIIKTRLTKYGGCGYDYILRDIVPRMRKRDFSDDDIDRILVDNPSRAFAFAE